MRRRVAALLLLLALAAHASATVVLRCDVEDLTDLCDGAVLGVVTARAVETERATGRLWTTYRVRVDETWLGRGAAEVVLSVPGGESGGVTHEFEGGARFEPGDRAAVFVSRRPDGRLLVLGEAQGAFRIRRDAATGADVCENSVEGLVLVDRRGKRAEAAPSRVTLDDLRARVATARSRREERERIVREAEERRRAERRRRAELHARLARGRPGAPPSETR